MKTLKKLFSVSAIVALLGTLAPMYAFGATYTAELEEAYAYAYKNGITTMTSIDNANMFGSLTRIAMAKMIANYATTVLGLEPDTSAKCSFTDVTAALDAQYDNGVTKACQLGLMGQNITAFRPNDPVTRAEFGTTLSRALNANSDDLASMNAANPYYKEHLNFLKNEGIMTQIDNPSMTEVRGYVMLMMMRADESYTPAEGCTAEELLKCVTADDYDACIAACNGEEPEEEQDPEEVKAGTLNVTMKSEEGRDIPNGISALPVVTYTLKATDEDINISSLVLSQAGYGTNGTITDAALFINGQRVSKAKDLDLNKDATINLTSAYTVKAGKSVDIEVRVTVGATPNEQFAVKLQGVESSAEKTKLPSNVTSDTFKVVATAASTSTITLLTAVDAPKAGTDNADIFEFSIGGNATQDVTVKNLTFMGLGSATTNAKDYKDFLKNVKLLLDNEVVATAEMNGKYLTFNLNKDVVVEKGKTEIFTVKADVIGGAGEDLDFNIENAMDVVINGNTYNAPVTVAGGIIGAVAPTAAKVRILAGKLTIERTNPNETTFVRNTKNVYLGSFTINNNGDNDLTMETMGLKVTSAALAGGLGSEEYIEAIKVRYGSTSAGLTELTMPAGGAVNGAILTDDTEVAIKGKTTVYVYADIAAKQLQTSTTTDVAFNKDENFSISLDKGSFKFVEDENDTLVTEVSYPASFVTMESANSTLTVTQVTLGNKSFSKGTADIDAVSFKIKTSTTAGVKIKNLVFDATSLARARATVALDAAGDGADTAKAAGAAAIAGWTYEKAVTAGDTIAYLIADLPATDIATLAANTFNGLDDADPGSSVLVDEGVATIDSNTIRNAKLIVNDKDEYDVTIGSNTITMKTPITLEANTTNTFVLKVSLESEPKAYSFNYIFDADNAAKSIAEDTTADRNAISPLGDADVNGRTISVLSAGTVTLDYEANAANNKNAKTILAGDSAVVAEYNLYATHEQARAKNIVLTFSDNDLIKDSVDDVEIYYGDELVASNPVWTVVSSESTATFNNVNLLIKEEETPLTVKLISSKINADGGKQLAAQTLKTVKLTGISGKISGIAIADATKTPTSPKTFAIVPVTLLATVDSVSNSNTNTLNVTATRGDNTDINNIAAKATITSIKFNISAMNGLTKITVQDADGTTVCTVASPADGDKDCDFTTPYLLSNGTDNFKVMGTVSSASDSSYTLAVKSVTYTTNVDNNVASNVYTTSPLLNVISR